MTKRGTNTLPRRRPLPRPTTTCSRATCPTSSSATRASSNPDGSFRDKADHIDQIKDYGFDLGGPIIKDKLWFYGELRQAGHQARAPERHARTRRCCRPTTPSSTGRPPATRWCRPSTSSAARRSSAAAPGSGLQRGRRLPLEPGQRLRRTAGRSGLWKLEVEPHLLAELLRVGQGRLLRHRLRPRSRGGQEHELHLDYVARARRSGPTTTTTRCGPQKTLNVDGNYFFAGAGRQPRAEVRLRLPRRDHRPRPRHWNGNQLVGLHQQRPTTTSPASTATATSATPASTWTSTSATSSPRTASRSTLGVRFDSQRAKNLASAAPANAALPDLLPALSPTAATRDDPHRLERHLAARRPQLRPRRGAQDGGARLVRALRRPALVRWASATRTRSPSGYLAYGWNDANGDRFVQPGEVLPQRLPLQRRHRPGQPRPRSAARRTRSTATSRPEARHEFIVGLDRELAANFAVGVAYTYRHNGDLTYTAPPRRRLRRPTRPPSSCRIIQPSEYTANAPVTASGYTAFSLLAERGASSTAGGGGRLRTNRPATRTNFNGLELTLNKRLSNKWMGRVAFSWNAFKQSLTTASSR